MKLTKTGRLSAGVISVADATQAYSVFKRQPLFTKSTLALADAVKEDGALIDKNVLPDGMLNNIKFSTQSEGIVDKDVSKTIDGFTNGINRLIGTTAQTVATGNTTTTNAGFINVSSAEGDTEDKFTELTILCNERIFFEDVVSHGQGVPVCNSIGDDKGYKAHVRLYVDPEVADAFKSNANNNESDTDQSKTLNPGSSEKITKPRMSVALDSRSGSLSDPLEKTHSSEGSGTKPSNGPYGGCSDQNSSKRKECSVVYHRIKWPAWMDVHFYYCSQQKPSGNERDNPRYGVLVSGSRDQCDGYGGVKKAFIVERQQVYVVSRTVHSLPIQGKALVGVTTDAVFADGSLVYVNDSRPSTAARVLLFPAEVVSSTVGLVIAVIAAPF
ncbi:MAG: hypothetical protein AAF668_11460 [Pseudomonadota bacterium]